MQVSRKEVTECGRLSALRCYPQMQLEWIGDGNIKQLKQKVVLKGSKKSTFLMVCHPPTPKGMYEWNDGEWSIVVDTCGCLKSLQLFTKRNLSGSVSYGIFCCCSL